MGKLEVSSSAALRSGEKQQSLLIEWVGMQVFPHSWLHYQDVSVSIWNLATGDKLQYVRDEKINKFLKLPKSPPTW